MRRTQSASASRFVRPKGGQIPLLPITESFRRLANELASPKVLHCPADSERRQTLRWEELTTNHLSYFIGLNADEYRPQTILSGDRNITGGTWTYDRVKVFRPGDTAGWDQGIHNGCGNITLADGSALQVTASGLNAQFTAAFASLKTNQLRLVMP